MLKLTSYIHRKPKFRKISNIRSYVNSSVIFFHIFLSSLMRIFCFLNQNLSRLSLILILISFYVTIILSPPPPLSLHPPRTTNPSLYYLFFYYLSILLFFCSKLYFILNSSPFYPRMHFVLVLS